MKKDRNDYRDDVHCNVLDRCPDCEITCAECRAMANKKEETEDDE